MPGIPEILACPIPRNMTTFKPPVVWAGSKKNIPPVGYFATYSPFLGGIGGPCPFGAAAVVVMRATTTDGLNGKMWKAIAMRALPRLSCPFSSWARRHFHERHKWKTSLTRAGFRGVG